MSYTFIIGGDRIEMDSEDPEELAFVEITEQGLTLATTLASSYGSNGHIINPEEATANDVDAALRQAGLKFSVRRSTGTAPISYTS